MSLDQPPDNHETPTRRTSYMTAVIFVRDQVLHWHGRYPEDLERFALGLMIECALSTNSTYADIRAVAAGIERAFAIIGRPLNRS